MKISQHFSLHEFTRSQTAARHGIDMTPSERIIGNLTTLCEHILEPLRYDLGGVPIIISSGWRPEVLNKMIGGSPTSEHVEGRASDIICVGLTPRFVCLRIRDALTRYNQNIHEFGEWTHVSVPFLGAIPKREDLTAYRRDGRTIYIPGIHDIKELM